MTHPEELKAIARRVVWFESPEQALENTQHFLTYLKRIGTAFERTHRALVLRQTCNPPSKNRGFSVPNTCRQALASNLTASKKAGVRRRDGTNI